MNYYYPSYSFSCLSDAYFLCVTQINGNLEMSFSGRVYLEYRLL